MMNLNPRIEQHAISYGRPILDYTVIEEYTPMPYSGIGTDIDISCCNIGEHIANLTCFLINFFPKLIIPNNNHQFFVSSSNFAGKNPLHPLKVQAL